MNTHTIPQQAQAMLKMLQELPHFFPQEISPFTASLLDDSLVEQKRSDKKTALQQSLQTSIHELRTVYRTFAEEMKNAESRLASKRKRLEHFKVWEEYAAHCPQNALDTALTFLGGMMHSCSSKESSEMLAGRIPQTIIARSSWFWFVRNFGHRALGEGDIALPRFADRPQATFALAWNYPQVRSYDAEFGALPPLTWKARFFTPRWNIFLHALEEQEMTRSSAMQNINRVRKELITSAEIFVQQGVLASIDQLWQMSAQDALRLE
jgi:hypothetical protein